MSFSLINLLAPFRGAEAPTAPADPPLNAPAESAGPALPPLKPLPRVLLVDDNEALRELLFDALEEAGYVVEVAPHGLAALGLAEEACPDVVLLDMDLPLLDGSSVLRAWDHDGLCQQAAVVALTAHPNALLPEQQAQVRALVTKPFDLDELLALVDRLAGPGDAGASEHRAD